MTTTGSSFTGSSFFSTRIGALRSILPITFTPGRVTSLRSSVFAGSGFGFSAGAEKWPVFLISISSFSKSLERRGSFGLSGNWPGSSFLIFPILICLASSLILLSKANSLSKAEYISLSNLAIGCFSIL